MQMDENNVMLFIIIDGGLLLLTSLFSFFLNCTFILRPPDSFSHNIIILYLSSLLILSYFSYFSGNSFRGWPADSPTWGNEPAWPRITNRLVIVFLNINNILTLYYRDILYIDTLLLQLQLSI